MFTGFRAEAFLHLAMGVLHISQWLTATFGEHRTKWIRQSLRWVGLKFIARSKRLMLRMMRS